MWNLFANDLKGTLSQYSSWFDMKRDQMKSRCVEKSFYEFIDVPKVVVSDCDGVLTDGRSWYDKDGKCLKVYGSHDKDAMKFLISLGWKFVFVSDDVAGWYITKARLDHMKKGFGPEVECQILNPSQRVDLVKQLVESGIQVLFIGDSLTDIKAMDVATYSGCPSNSFGEVKQYANYVSELAGSYGAFADIVMNVNDKMFELFLKNNE